MIDIYQANFHLHNQGNLGLKKPWSRAFALRNDYTF